MNELAGDITALVVNWSTPEDLVGLIKSAEVYERHLTWGIWQNHHPTIKSTVELGQISRSLRGRSIVGLSAENDGHGKGTNQIAEFARRRFSPEYLFLVNPDCLFTNSILHRMVEFLEEDLERFTVGPKQVDSIWRITAGGIVGDGKHPRHRGFQDYDPRNELFRDAQPGPTISGAAMLVRTKDFFEYGGLLEANHYYSETWLNYHARAHGRSCWYFGEAWMIHEWHQSHPRGSPMDALMGTDREMFRKKCDEHIPPIARD